MFDASREISSYLIEYVHSVNELKDVQFRYLDETIGRKNDTTADTSKPIRWSYDLLSGMKSEYREYDGDPLYNTSYYPDYVTEASYIINLSCLRGHNLAGFTASAKNHFGTIMPGRTEKDGSISFPSHYRSGPPTYAGLHMYVSANDGYYMSPAEKWDLPKRPMGSYTVLVDLLSNVDCGGKTLLYICDGLAASVHQGSELNLSEQWYTFGENGGKGWPCSILISQDPVALDSVAYDFIIAEKNAAEAHGDNKWRQSWGPLKDGHTAENYLIEAALAYNPPSGTFYQDGYGNLITSLGVHEHWNPETKLYSGNITPGTGIELIRVTN